MKQSAFLCVTAPTPRDRPSTAVLRASEKPVPVVSTRRNMVHTTKNGPDRNHP
jgi:hypothetical protein